MTPHRNERGAVTVWLAGASVLMVSIIGITVDLGGQLHAKERAHTIAAQAARTGAEQITADAMLGTKPRLDVGRARTAANAYLRAAGEEEAGAESGESAADGCHRSLPSSARLSSAVELADTVRVPTPMEPRNSGW